MIATNKILHALSNRTGPFETPIFAADLVFSPAITAQPETMLRHKLCLDVTDTDYYLKVYLSIISAFPDIARNLQDTVTSYRLSDFPPAGVVVEGGDLASFSNMLAYFTDAKASIFPVPLSYGITYVSDNTAELSIKNTSRKARVPCRTSGTEDHLLLHLEWPDDFPFIGPVLLKQKWIVGAYINIQVEPSKFPFETVVGILASDACMSRLLMDFGMAGQFANAVDPRERLAIALMVLCLSNSSVYGPDVLATELPGHVSGAAIS